MRKKCPIPRRNLNAARIRAVQARRSGVRTKDVATMLDVSPITVSRWIGRYSRLGARGLLGSKSQGRPKKLDCEKVAPEILSIIKAPATRYGFSNPLWNKKRLVQVSKNELGIVFSKTTLWRLLRSLKLTYQVPERRSFEASARDRKIWIKKTWPALLKKAKKERAVIFFQDEASVSLTPNLGKTWSKIGRTPITTITGKKGSISILSAISHRGRLLFKIPEKNVNSKEFVLFLKQILTEVPRKKIYIITDKSSSHTSKYTKSFIKEESLLQVIFLPSYSPDLNCDEHVWARLKQIEMKNHNATSLRELKNKTSSSMKSIQKRLSILRSFLR